MTTPTLSTWWPPVGSHEVTEAEVRELFAYLRIVVPPVMTDARRRIRDRVGDDPVRVDYVTVKQLEAEARAFDVSVDVLIEKSLRLARRVVEIGQDAFDRDFTAELGVTVMEFRSEAWQAQQEREWHAFKELDRARRAEIVHYRGGVMYRGGVPVTS